MKRIWVAGRQKVGRTGDSSLNTFLYLFTTCSESQIKKKKSDYGSCCVSSLRAQYKINHWPQNPAYIGKKMRSFSTLRTLFPSDEKVAISKIHAACVWKCTLIACTLYSYSSCQNVGKGKADKHGKEAGNS